MRVLVAGGTGFIGRALVHALEERGDDAVVVSRRGGDEAIGWDAVAREIERVDAVVNLAGEAIADGRWSRARLEAIRESRVKATSTIARAIGQSARKPRVFVSASAVGVYGARDDDRPLLESAPPGNDALARIVVAWEAAADPARDAGTRVVHPRTGVVLGRGGGALEKMAGPFRWFLGGPLGGGRQWVSWIHLEDAVRALVLAIDVEGLVGPVNVVAPEPVTMENLAQAIGRVLRRPSALRVPPWVLKLALGNGLANTVLTGQRVLPRKLLDSGFVFEFPQIDQACADLLP